MSTGLGHENQTSDVNTLNTAANATERREVEIDTLLIPDVWHLACTLDDVSRDRVLAVWHLAHDMRDKLQVMRSADTFTKI